MPDPAAPLRLGLGCRLQWEEAQGRYVLLYPEGLVELNPSAAMILELCDGRSEAAIVAELTRRFEGADLAEDVRAFLAHALEQGWVRHAEPA